MHNAKLIKLSLTSGCNYTSIRHFFQNDILKKIRKNMKNTKSRLLYMPYYTHIICFVIDYLCIYQSTKHHADILIILIKIYFSCKIAISYIIACIIFWLKIHFKIFYFNILTLYVFCYSCNKCLFIYLLTIKLEKQFFF